MDKSTADELARVVNIYQDHPNIRDVGAWAIQKDDEDPESWQVLVLPLGDRYTEVPDRLPLTSDPCPCTLPGCANRKVAPSLLKIVRAGGRAPV